MAARLSALSADELASLPRTKPEARALKSKYYFTGKSCKRGHRDGRDTVSGKCCTCAALHHALYYQEHRESLDKRHAEYAKNNREKTRAYTRKCRCRKLDHYKHVAKEWIKNNFARVKENKKSWRLGNPELVRLHNFRSRIKRGRLPAELTRKWRERDPIRAKRLRNESAKRHPETQRRLKRARRARSVNAPGSHTDQDLAEILKMQGGKCAYCRSRFGKSLRATLDHIVALKNGGSHDRRNLQFLCATCNSKKGARDAIEFSRAMGRLL